MTSEQKELQKAIEALDEIGVICTDGSSAAEIIANGQELTPKAKADPKPEAKPA
jgi:hypothetical protein